MWVLRSIWGQSNKHGLSYGEKTIDYEHAKLKSVGIIHTPQGEEPCHVTTVQMFRQDARRGKAPVELWK